MTIEQEWEESFYKEGKREFKKERKIAANKDRSKYKKTDQDKFLSSGELHANIKKEKEAFERGQVVSITSAGIFVESDHKTFQCTLRGLLKKERTADKNLIAVGDFVLFEKTSSDEGQIVHVEPRFSILSRADNLSRRKQQLIAANVDQVLITTALVEPGIKPVLVDRYLIAAEKGGMKGIIVVNKLDLLPHASAEEQAFFREFETAYRAAGWTLIAVSSQTGEGIEALKGAMRDKTSVFSGQSGVGKTSLINLVTGLNLRTRELVEKTGKGAHTTTHARLIPLKEGGFCIDTPGIKSFGVWNLTPKELLSYFPDIEKYSPACHFPDCSHIHEERCAVQKAVENQTISPLRYDSYCQLLQSLGEEHLRR